MENGTFDLEKYLSNGVDNIISNIVRNTLKNPKESSFMAGFAINSKKAGDIRHRIEKEGKHIPPFLIASITNKCNLHCKGCYARANHSCNDSEESKDVLDADEWKNIFEQAERIGITAF